MGRLKRSCVVGSVVFHALTLALLLLAPVLLAKRVEKVQVIDLIPSEIVDQIMAPTGSRCRSDFDHCRSMTWLP